MITSSPSITTEALTVDDFANFRNEVMIGGSLTVHGSVVGSGPYVDSSDERVKENVHNVSKALDMVMQLRPVSLRVQFYSDCDSFLSLSLSH